MLRLPRLVPSPMCVPAQYPSCSACTLIDVGAEVGEHPTGERPGDAEPEVEHPDAGERVGECAGRGRPHGATGAGVPRLREDRRRCVRRAGAAGRARRRASRRTRAPARRGGCGPTSGSSTSTTQPSARNESSASASAGERTSATPMPAASPAATHSSGRELLERVGEHRVQEHPGEHAVGLHRDAVGIVAVRGVERRPATSSSPSAEANTQLGRTVQWCTHRPSAHS